MNKEDKNEQYQRKLFTQIHTNLVYTLFQHVTLHHTKDKRHTSLTLPSFLQQYKQAGGAFAFITALAGWWIFFAIMLASIDFPYAIPVGDLSTLIKGASERQAAKDAV